MSRLPSLTDAPQVLTHTGDCFDAKVSPNGNVGWIQSAKMEHLTDNEGVTYPKMVAVNKDSLVVRLLDGKPGSSRRLARTPLSWTGGLATMIKQ